MMEFLFVKQRRGSKISIFSSGNLFLKIGSRLEVDREETLLKKLLQLGFPVAKIVNSGSIGRQRYILEKSLGNKHFGDVFSSECVRLGVVSNSSIRDWIRVTTSFARAQTHTVLPPSNLGDFLMRLHYQVLLEELPHLKDKLHRAFRLVRRRLSRLPCALTHGDLNAHNVLPKGVIDFESGLSGPFGYDLVTNLVHPYFFPRQGPYEIVGGYEFTPDQILTYCKRLSQLCQNADLPSPFLSLDEFILCRAVWAAAKMAHTPRLQKWRFHLLGQLLKNYGRQKLFPLLVSLTRPSVNSCTI